MAAGRLSLPQIESIRAALFAEDVEPPLPQMYHWTPEQATAFFESNGEVWPQDVGTAPSRSRWKVIHHPYVAVGEGARAGGFVMINHPELGMLLSSEVADAQSAQRQCGDRIETAGEKANADPLKVKFETKVSRKACGANLKTTDVSGASRDALFDHYVEQEIVPEFRQAFRRDGIPTQMYDTDYATDTECISWCQVAGQLGPVPLKGGGRKVAACGVRQRVETLGELRCIVVEKDEDSEKAPQLLVVMAHGINVLGDDLFGLAYYCATHGNEGMARVRFVLPGAPEECEKPKTVQHPPSWDSLQHVSADKHRIALAESACSGALLVSTYSVACHERAQELLRPPLRWFEWEKNMSTDTVEAHMRQSLPIYCKCVRDAIAKAPDARLALCGFSQGAVMSLYAACSELKPTALIQLCGQAPFAALPMDSLGGVKVLVAAGDKDTVAPLHTAEKLLEACREANGDPEPLFHFDGGHEVTLEVASHVALFLKQILAQARVL